VSYFQEARIREIQVNLLFSLNGRIGRLYWWLGELGILLLLVAGFIIVGESLGDSYYKAPASAQVVAVLALIICVCLATWINICVTVKRYHDRNKSGWWFFVAMVPLVGAIWQLVECGFLAGTTGANDYGDGGAGEALNAEIDALRGATQPASGGLAQQTSVSFERPAPAQQPRPGNAARASFGRRGA
jgi:uncharacterized membrane protein YhaH (DUF805 family)